MFQLEASTFSSTAFFITSSESEPSAVSHPNFFFGGWGGSCRVCDNLLGLDSLAMELTPSNRCPVSKPFRVGAKRAHHSPNYEHQCCLKTKA